jgi:hypothetical protein
MRYNLAESLHERFCRSHKSTPNMSPLVLRVIVDGDSDKVYRKGDKVTGRVILVVEEEEQVQSLKVVFAGNCITKTTRPFHVNGSPNAPARREHEEKLRLFEREKDLVPASTLAPNKYTWTFDFTFPELTEPRYKRLTHGANYLREPHALPPTFQLKTNVRGGAAQISYFVQARLTLGGSRDVKRCRVVLPYHPTPAVNPSREAKCVSAVLYGQAWKPAKEESKSTSNMFSKVSRRSSPRIIPSIVYPESVAPGQHIPISVHLRNTRDALNEAQGDCTIDSLSITISTYSTCMCGHDVTQPEDIVSKHVTCIARTDMKKKIRFGITTPLTSNFRLIDDVECVPTFKTYTITRRYTLDVSIGIKYGEQHFTVRSTTPLEIVPRVPRSALPIVDDADDFDPLPLYSPREPSRELAPDYEELFPLSRMASSVSSSSAPPLSRSGSYTSDTSGMSTSASTPESEIDGMIFGLGVEGRVAVPG